MFRVIPYDVEDYSKAAARLLSYAISLQARAAKGDLTEVEGKKLLFILHVIQIYKEERDGKRKE